MISYYNIKKADPFLEYKKIKYFHYNIHLFWSLAKKYINEDHSEVSRNRKYFLNVPELAQIKRVKAEDVLRFIDTHLNEVDEYVRELDKIYGLFYQMVSDYTACVDYYRTIISHYNKLKDLYLAPENEIFPLLDTLQHLFDSTMSMYELYKAALESYPLKKYNQRLVLRPITLYRLEGVTNTDFLSDTLLFWDYGQWNKQTRNVITTEILKLRSKIELHFNKLTRVENSLLGQTKYSDDYTGYFLPTQIIFQIEKYDINSIVGNILKYKKAKTDLLAFRLHKFNDTTDTTVKLVARANFYSQEEKMFHALDSMLDVVQGLNNEVNIHKYKDFFNLHFSKGLDYYIAGERRLLKVLEQKDREHFKYFIFRDVFNYSYDSAFVLYHGDTLRLYPWLGHVTRFVIMDVGHDPLYNIFVAGVMQKGGSWSVFVAKATKGTVQWLKTIPIEHGYLVPIVRVFPYTDGVVIDVYQVNNQGKGYNAFYRFDQLGNKGFTLRSQVRFVPRFIYYDDINGYLISAYKGMDRDKWYSSDSLVIEKWNIGQKHLMWRHSFAQDGQMVNIQRFDSVYYAFVNYTSFTDQSGRVFSSDSNSVGVIRITESGVVLQFNPLKQVDGLYLIYALKLTSRKIDLLGFNSAPFPLHKRKFDQLPELRSIIINKF